jgi:hypothetical protein
VPRKKSFKNKLEQNVGFEEIQFVIPHAFLPPRFRDISDGRNMLLCLDLDVTIHVRWEGAHQNAHHPLTPGAARRLLRECKRNMTRYRTDLTTFANFLDAEAEEPSWELREFSEDEETAARPAKEAKEEGSEEGREVTAVIPSTENLGGESPHPDMESWSAG